ncbi:hypothetical protein DFH28DRAFT_1118063 [Melampsora americana]|nr:hypothetical protein DFH28DRAFT_1118063 [Melampsora americana]
MTLSKAARAQRKRRKAEHAHQSRKLSQSDSDSELEIIEVKELAKPVPPSPANIIWSLPGEFSNQEQDINMDTDIEIETDNEQNNNKNNQIIQTIKQNLLDSDDEDACDQRLVWESKSTRMTKSYRNKKMKKALGNGPSISSYFTKPIPITSNLSNHNSDDEKETQSDSEEDASVSDDHNTEDTMYNDIIESRVQQYRETQKIAKVPVDRIQKINDQWEELDSALRQAKDIYERKNKDNPQFFVPDFEIAELRCQP